MNILVTGSSGFVGAHIVRELASRGSRVVAATLGSPTRAALAFLEEHAPVVKWVSVDVRESRQVEEAARRDGVDAIVHGAAVTSVSHDVSVSDMVAANIVGTRNVLEAARTLNLSRVVYLSSGAVYGTRAPYPTTVGEDHPLRGDGPYAVSKIASEHLCRIYAREQGYSVFLCRLGTLYGPVETPNPHRPRVSIPCNLLSLALGKRSMKVWGASRRRPFCYVGDAARAVVDLALLPSVSSDTFNIGSPDAVGLSDLLDIVSRLEKDFAYEVVSRRDDADLAMTRDDERPVLDTAHLESVLGRLRWTPIEEGLETTLGWLRRNS